MFVNLLHRRKMYSVWPAGAPVPYGAGPGQRAGRTRRRSSRLLGLETSIHPSQLAMMNPVISGVQVSTVTLYVPVGVGHGSLQQRRI